MSKDRLQVSFDWFCTQWLEEKKKAKETGDYEQYSAFLEQAKNNFEPLFTKLKKDAWIDLVGTILQDIYKEIRAIKGLQSQRK